ncbi:hypothetical protein FDECE_18124 [Fusarium decemcellulare]|nr:hypothetical protein FDECE_18124 [Fusarium decemcellulare]
MASSPRKSRHQPQLFAGANVNKRGARGSALHMAIRTADVDMVGVLLKAGFDTSIVADNKAPLCMAVNRRCHRIAEKLRQAGATTCERTRQCQDYKDASACTTIHHAIRRLEQMRGTDIVEYLVGEMIRAGGSLAMKYDDGPTLVEFAVKTAQKAFRRAKVSRKT